jgi:hypothetical protein
MSFSVDPELIAKYLKIWALAELGAGGERETARKRMAEMAQKYPGIHVLAESARSYTTGSPLPGNAPADIWEMLRTAASAAWELYGSMADLRAGEHAARRARPFVDEDVTESGKPRVRIGFEFGALTQAELRELDDAGREGFRRTAHDLLEEALDSFCSLLDRMDEDADDEVEL